MIAASTGRAWGSLVAALVIATIWLSAPVVAAQDGGETITLAAYADRIAAGERAVAHATGLDTTKAIADVAADLRRISAVRLPSGAAVYVRPLLTGQERPEVALARLRLVDRQLAEAEHDRTMERLAQLDDVLARAEFAPDGDLLTWLRRALNSQQDAVQEPSSRVPALAARALNWVIAIVGGLVALVVLSLLIQALLGGFVTDVRLRRSADGEEDALTAADARQQAAEQARVGNFREAVRRLYLATLLNLADRGLLRYDRSLTNREVLMRMPAESPLRARLTPVIDTFESVWYGVREPDQQTFDAYRAAVDVTGEAMQAATRDMGAGKHAGGSNDTP